MSRGPRPTTSRQRINESPLRISNHMSPKTGIKNMGKNGSVLNSLRVPEPVMHVRRVLQGDGVLGSELGSELERRARN